VERLHHGDLYTPSYLIADAAEAISNAFIAVFGPDTTIIMCWAHMRKNVRKQVDALVPKELREEILNDLDTLQLSPSTEVFEKAVPLSLKSGPLKNKKLFLTI